MTSAYAAEIRNQEWAEFPRGKFHRLLPPMSMSEAVTGETRLVFITKEGAGDDTQWCLKAPYEPAHRFDTLDQALEAGNKVVDVAYARQSDQILEDAEIDSASWRFVDRNGPDFVSLADESVLITRFDATRWQLLRADEVLGLYPTARAAARAFMPEPAPKM